MNSSKYIEKIFLAYSGYLFCLFGINYINGGYGFRGNTFFVLLGLMVVTIITFIVLVIYDEKQRKHEETQKLVFP